LVFLGDISYALYLIHWPVIVFFLHHKEKATIDSCDSFFCIIFLTMTLTLSAHFTVEKWSMRAGMRTNALYVGVVYIVIYLLLLHSNSISDALLSNRINDLSILGSSKGESDEWKPDMNFTKEQIREIIEYNQNRELLPIPPYQIDEEARRWTNYTDEPEHNLYSFIWKGTGNLSVLLLGNSFAWRASPVIHDVFMGHFKELRVYTHLGCCLLTDIDCPKYRVAYSVVLEKMHPHITLVIARFVNECPDPSIS
ncbi:hypothetical protein PFISCL1PPCAC_2216, partial [Pristionchus fissidentatus]